MFYNIDNSIDWQKKNIEEVLVHIAVFNGSYNLSKPTEGGFELKSSQETIGIVTL